MYWRGTEVGAVGSNRGKQWRKRQDTGSWHAAFHIQCVDAGKHSSNRFPTAARYIDCDMDDVHIFMRLDSVCCGGPQDTAPTLDVEGVPSWSFYR